MLKKIMELSVKKRAIILIVGVTLTVFGIIQILNTSVDVFPDLTAPTVTVMTECHGLAPEEVEKLVTQPIEYVLNGSSGIRRLRSNSIQGLSTIWVEFDWGTDIFRARQIVNEKIQFIQNELPREADSPVLAPITSIMGEIMLVGLTSDSVTPMELRNLAEYQLRRRLLSLPGIAQILVYGGEVMQYRVEPDPMLMKKQKVGIDQVFNAVARSNVNASGGIFIQSGQEYLIRGIGRISHISDLENTVVTVRNNIPLLLRDVANVSMSAATKIGEASINNQKGVILIITKQPAVNTLELTDRIDSTLADIRASLPEGIIIHGDIFKQADFIDVAVNNLTKALFEGAALVIVILFLFLGNIRTTFISVMAIPASLIISALILRLFNFTINTMTLGGMAIALGVLVDDAIIYVENLFRRLNENQLKAPDQRKKFYNVVIEASSEISTPIAMATFIVMIVFLPLFFLSGVEGRMLKPLGLAYVTSIGASLLVAITITPALSSYMFKNFTRFQKKDSWILVHLKRGYRYLLEKSIKHWRGVLAFTLVLVAASILIYSFLGNEFLPEFNEGTLNISLATLPGTSLEESDKIGSMVETILLGDEAVVSTARRTGRAELDEHSMGSYAHEMEVKINLEDVSKHELMDRLRKKLAVVPGANITIGQPISHRIDHMLSGTRSTIAVKIFGEEFSQLREIAKEVEEQMQTVQGVVDLSIEQQTDIPQIIVKFDRIKMAQYNLSSEDLDFFIDISFLGLKVSQVYKSAEKYDLVIRYPKEYRNNAEALRSILVPNRSSSDPSASIPLEEVATIVEDRGPNYISRENVRRKLVVSSNVSDRDIRSTVQEIREKIARNINLPEKYFIEFGGQFESEERASKTIFLLSLLAITAILIALYLEFGNIKNTLIIMINLPLALIGGVFVVFFTTKILNIASLVGFITLFGIAVRNGIMMISHYEYLLKNEGLKLYDVVIKGSMERLAPIVMTALTTGLALLPLALAADQPGSEIQAPMSIVILAGLFSATFLNLFIVPITYVKLSSKKQQTRLKENIQ